MGTGQSEYPPTSRGTRYSTAAHCQGAQKSLEWSGEVVVHGDP